MADKYVINSADLTSVADALRAKGGTFDALVFPTGFISAVQAISAGVNVQEANGSFTTNTSGNATVNCGFQPDIVIIFVGAYDGYESHICFPFADKQSSYTACGIAWITDGIIEGDLTQTTTGFAAKMILYDWSFSETVQSRKTYSYKAMKYT